MDQGSMGQNTMNGKSMTTAYLLWFFLGGFGVHRMYVGKTGSGFGMLGLFVGSVIGTMFVIGMLGFPVLGIWWLVDAFMINKWFKESQSAGRINRPQPSSMEPPMSNAA